MWVWVLGLYLRGLNLSNEPIARQLGRDLEDAPLRASQLREGNVPRKPELTLNGEGKCDEVAVSVVAGPKGHPLAVRKQGESAAPGG